MPFLSLHVLDQVSRGHKARLVAELTHSLISVLGKKPEHIHVVIHEVNRDNWGFAGHLMSSPATSPAPSTRSRHPAASRRRRPKAERRNGKSPAPK